MYYKDMMWCIKLPSINDHKSANSFLVKNAQKWLWTNSLALSLHEEESRKKISFKTLHLHMNQS
jgi:hypothetical protein